jgi:solute carrier family 20 (sodium-dependent phosphate transporter)
VHVFELAGLPVSTTQIMTGAVLAIGLFEGAKGVNWRMFAKIFLGWVTA